MGPQSRVQGKLCSLGESFVPLGVVWSGSAVCQQGFTVNLPVREATLRRVFEVGFEPIQRPFAANWR